MSDLIERVKDALENSGESPWLPGLSEELANVGWRDLYRDLGLTPSNYGTARVMARDASAPRRIVARLPIVIRADGSGHFLQVETLEKDFARSYEEVGVRFYTEDEISGAKVLEQIVEAINILQSFPPLCAAVATLVKSAHLIDPADDDYDISFSEPHIPFTIFVSVPCLRNINDALRITEALVHEAMHLQLTLVEQVVALINPADGRYFSPWRGEYRTARGLLHAIYVFRVIDCFFGELFEQNLIPSKYTEYVLERRNEIDVQISEVHDFPECPELTKLGKAFAQRLI